MMRLERLGVVMEPEPGSPLEVEGTLNPGSARGPDGRLYLFPRLVATGNYSRIGVAQVIFDDGGVPRGVERLGVVLEPREEYELRADGGGVEDPRVTFVPRLGKYVMTYTAYGPAGPRVAIAVSQDLMAWERLGLVDWASLSLDGQTYAGPELDEVNNKDAVLFPEPVRSPHGEKEFALMHRPLFEGTTPHELVHHSGPRRVDLHKESIWISYAAIPPEADSLGDLCHFDHHHRVASPVAEWERLKIGAGTPPVMTKHGWLAFYHGVSGASGAVWPDGLTYAAGLMVLERDDPRRIICRLADPVLFPETDYERKGVVSNVVFPTAIDVRDDIGEPDLVDVYYGMADRAIGVARMRIPDELPVTAAKDAEGLV